ncbi:MAG TPA: hypothetical protein PKK06_11645 [Phycisphaerae bacterium]|nr:hypothetical protein [Phycisphaerae bacterium]HNU45885.1 hypothetical protein [Phycisphaerae bacterium]
MFAAVSTRRYTDATQRLTWLLTLLLAEGALLALQGTPGALAQTTTGRAPAEAVRLEVQPVVANDPSRIESGTPESPGGAAGDLAQLDGQLRYSDTAPQNICPVVLNLPAHNHFAVTAPETLDCTLQVSSPEPTQTTTVRVLDPNGAQAAGLHITATSGTPTTVRLRWETESANAGAYVLTLEVADDDPVSPCTVTYEVSIEVAGDPPNPPQTALPTGDATAKGSVIVFPKVELRWNRNTGQLIQDTFLDLCNDSPGLLGVQLFFVNGDPPAAAVYGPGGVLVERAHPGYNRIGLQIALTGNEPAFWSAFTGQEKHVAPFTILDPPWGPFNAGNPLTWPGRPATDGSTDRVLRGFVVGWAVNFLGEKIRWNHLKGDALILNYDECAAWEVNAWAFQTTAVAHGSPVPGDPEVLSLDGFEYDACPTQLMLDFYAVGANALDSGTHVVDIDTDLTLLPMIIDLRQETTGPTVTKAKFDIWNQNEVKFSNTERCITHWDQQLLSRYSAPNHFLRPHLQTNKGKARIDGLASATVCGAASIPSPLLGVAAKLLTFGGVDVEIAGVNLVGMGEEAGCIRYDPEVPPPELFQEPAARIR